MEINRPSRMRNHWSRWMEDRRPVMASAAPLMPEMSAWLSLVGIPRARVLPDHSTVVKRDAQSAKSAQED